MGQRVSAHQRAYDHLKERLITGGFDEGVFITEVAVAEEVGISRTPVREALLRLDAEKLLMLVPGRGAFIPQITERTMREVMEARELIETHAVAQLAAGADGLVSGLRGLLDEQSRCNGDAASFIDCDRQFHQRIIDAAGNHLLSELYVSLRDRQTRMGLRAVLANEERVERVVHEHTAIVDAIEANDLPEAVAASRVHHQATLKTLLERRP